MFIPPRDPRESGREYALRTVRENIVQLTLAPGSMVSENELGAALGLSRTPVREALVELSREQLVEIYPQRGSAVAPIDYALVEESCFLRRVLEREVVMIACEKATEQQKVEIMDNIALQEHSLGRASAERMMQLDNQLHRLLFAAACKENLWKWMTGLTLHFDRVRRMAIETAQVERNVADHRAIAQAVLEGDASRAAALMEHHLTRYRVDEESLRAHYPVSWFKNA